MKPLEMIDAYANFIKAQTSFAHCGDYIELTVPYLDRHNDFLQIYVKQDKNGRITMTDDGAIIGDLISSGLSVRSGTIRRTAIDDILRNFSMHTEGNDIITTATRENFPFKKHLMVQAMLQIDDLYASEPGAVKDYFFEDIRHFLDKNGVIYLPRIAVTGKSGTNSAYDFAFPKNPSHPERFCKAINRLTESTRNMAIFNWLDTKDVRSKDARMLILINDANTVKQDDLEAFTAYDIDRYRFSNKSEVLDAVS